MYKIYLTVFKKSLLLITVFFFFSGNFIYAEGKGELSDFQKLTDSLNSPNNVYFEFNEYELRQNALPLLDELANVIKEQPGTRIEIRGFCDNIGSQEYNLELSMKRTMSVIYYLISKGCKEENFVPTGFGKDNPIADNSTNKGRALNRRVEFKWIIEPVYAELNANGLINPISRNEIKMELNVNDEDDKSIIDLKEENISATLKWNVNNIPDSTKGTVRLIPIDDQKKLAVALTMDYSGSMWNLKSDASVKTPEILGMERAVMKFINEMNDKMYAMIIKFGTDVQIAQHYTNDINLLRKVVESSPGDMGWTSLFKSIHVALQDTTFNSDPTFMKCVIAFTDGEENRSREITFDSVVNMAVNNGIRIYTVGMFEPEKHTDPPGMNYIGEEHMVNIANQTGGFYYYAPQSDALTKIYSSIVTTIKNSYSVSIYWNESKLPPKGTPVKAVVTIKMKHKIKKLTRDYIIQ